MEIRLIGMLESDLVNIRTTREMKINAEVLSYNEAPVSLNTNQQILLPQNGQSFAETALSVTETSVTFSRPHNNGKMLIDVEVPELSQLQFFYNDVKVLNNVVLDSPISVQNGKLGKGEDKLYKATSKLFLPQDKIKGENETWTTADGRLFVPFSKLQIRSSEPLPDNLTAVKTLIEIDENGVVERVVAYEENTAVAQDIEQRIRQWRFAPHKNNGVAVKVKTAYLR